MKIRKYIYLILGIIIIVLDLLGTYSVYADFKSHFPNFSFDIVDLAITFVILLIGLAFLFGAYRIQQKIKKGNRQILENAFSELNDLQ